MLSEDLPASWEHLPGRSRPCPTLTLAPSCPHVLHLAKFHIPLSQADPDFLQEGSCDSGLSEPQCVDSLQAQSPWPAHICLLLLTFSDVPGAGGGHTTAEVVPGSP